MTTTANIHIPGRRRPVGIGELERITDGLNEIADAFEERNRLRIENAELKARIAESEARDE